MKFTTIVRIRARNRYRWPQQDAEIIRWVVKDALAQMVPEQWGTHQWVVTRPFLRTRGRS